jgi:CRP-like cAMP-binding protein
VYVKTYKKGEIICREGELGDEFYIIKKGSIMISSDNPQHKFLRYLYEGDYFGEACFFDHFLRTANATSV